MKNDSDAPEPDRKPSIFELIQSESEANPYPSQSKSVKSVRPFRLSYNVDSHFLVSLINVLGDMIDGNSANQHFMQKQRGFAVIANILEKVSPKHLTVETVEAVQNIVSNVMLHANFYRVRQLMFDWLILRNPNYEYSSQVAHLTEKR